MSRRWARYATTAVAVAAMLVTSGCLGSAPMVVDSYTDGSGVRRCVTGSSSISTTLTPAGDITSTTITQARKNANCATAESGIGPWEYLKAQTVMSYKTGPFTWQLCASTGVTTTTTAQFVLPNIAHECGTHEYQVTGLHWTERGTTQAFAVTLTPIIYFIIWP